MADDFDFGFSAVSTEEFKKTQPTEVKVQKPTVSTNEFKELKSKIDSIVGMIQTLGDNDDTSLFDETGEKISRLEGKIDKILALESSQVATALNEQFMGKLKELESLVIPMLKGLMKNADKEYIYWPGRTPILEKQIEKVYSITRPE